MSTLPHDATQRAWSFTAPDDPSMREPERWLAVLRIVVGLWFLKSLLTKLTLGWAGGILPIAVAGERWRGFLPQRLSGWAEVNPIGWYRDFLLDVALPNASAFATLTAIGESLVGLSLTLGLLTGAGALGGLFLMLNYLLASLGTGLNQQGFHILLVACLLAFLLTRAGRRWGVDGWLARHRPVLFRRLPLV